jgi:lipoprotein-releasing system permease protein
MYFEYFIGGRYLRSRQKHAFISFITLLSMAGVTVGVMALIIVISVMSGAESYFKSQILGVEAHVVLRRHGGEISDYRDVIEQLQARKGVISADPFIHTQVMLRSASNMSGAVLRGMDPEAAGAAVKGYSRKELKDRLTLETAASEESSVPGIILGKELAMNLGVSEGAVVYIISPRGMMSPVGHIPAMKRFEVTGVFSSGFS